MSEVLISVVSLVVGFVGGWLMQRYFTRHIVTISLKEVARHSPEQATVEAVVRHRSAVDLDLRNPNYRTTDGNDDESGSINENEGHDNPTQEDHTDQNGEDRHDLDDLAYKGFHPRIAFKNLRVDHDSLIYIHDQNECQVPAIPKPPNAQIYLNLKFMKPRAKARIRFDVTGDLSKLDGHRIHFFNGRLPNVDVRGAGFLKPPPDYLRK